jgi:hypothetical protein
MRRFLRLLLPLLVVTALAGACGGDDGDDDVSTAEPGGVTSTTLDPDTAVSSPAVDDDGAASDPAWQRIEPMDELMSSVVATPVELVPDPEDPNAVLVRFYGGVQPCNGAHVSAVETDTTVTVTLEVGSNPTAGGQACIEIAEAQELQVVLDAPVGDRELVAESGDR